MKFKSASIIVMSAIFAAVLLTWTGCKNDDAAPVSEGQRLKDVYSTLPIPKAWAGDLDEMYKRRLIRILVPYSKTLYFLDQGRVRGVVHDTGRELEKRLNLKHGSKALPIRVIFIPTAREHILQDLVDGYGDIAAGNLTTTPDRLQLVDFTETGFRDVSEIVVTGPSAPEIKNLDNLAGVPVYVRKSSSYYEHLIGLMKNGVDLDVRLVDEVLEDEDLLEMVNVGLLPLAIIDNHKAKFWAQIFAGIVLREDLVINQGGRIGWAIRKSSPLLAAELNDFGQSEGRRKGLANMLLRRYLGSTKYVLNATNSDELAKFDSLVGLFKSAAETYDLDYQLLMAQGYQESRLNQAARSHAGAVGIMQLLPSTAASKAVGIKGIEKDKEKNINAGAKYMRHLLDVYLNDPEIDEINRILLGPGRLQRRAGEPEEDEKKSNGYGIESGYLV